MRVLNDVVIVGASLAGLRAATTLRREGFAGSITLIGDESTRAYDRPPLSKEVMRGERGPDELVLPGVEDLDAVWKLGSPAVSLDPGRKVVETADGTTIRYDGLVLATGSSARTLPPFDGLRSHVHTLRRIDDAVRLRQALRPGTRLLVIGCGFVGIEVASSARSLGAEVAVIGLDPPVAPAGPLASEVATRLLVEAGVAVHPATTFTEVTPVGEAYRVELTDGDVVEADEILVAVGAVPNVAWLAGSGVSVAGGVECDETLRVVGLDDVVAAGDIARWPSAAAGGELIRIEHWSNAVEQGMAAARTLLAGPEAAPFVSVPSFWSDHFGIRLQSIGLPHLADRFEVTAGDPDDGTFCAEAYAGETLVGGVTYGMPRPLLSIRTGLIGRASPSRAATR